MGSIICKIQEEPIDFLNWMEKLDQAGCGATTWFSGCVRKLNLLKEGCAQEVKGITYEAYEILAEKILNEIGLEMQKRYGGSIHILVVHRVGYLKVGECSILIGVSSPHRAPAYEASRAMLEEIKKRVPIWKLEHYTSGESQWLKGQSLNV